MISRRQLAILSIGLSLSIAAHSHPRPDSHAPISVMADHTHNAGEVMVSYRYMTMSMNDVLDGTDDASNSDVYSAGYMNAPSDMSMSMHMLGMMWGLPRNITLVGMVPYTSKSMKVTPNPMMMNESKTMESSGLGDVKLTALVDVKPTPTRKMTAGLGVSFPTGAIDQTDTMPNGMEGTLGYGMQLGSGTVDLLPSFTAVKFFNSFSVGAQVNGTIRLGENNKGYTLGSEGNISTWIAKQWCTLSSSSLQLRYRGTNPIVGQHSDIANSAMAPGLDTTNSGRSDLLLGIGNNVIIPKGFLEGYRIGLDVILPLSQSVNGLQMKLDSQWTLGLQKTF